MTSKLRRLKKFCFNRYPAVSGKGWWHHILIFETSIFTKLFQQSPLARQLCKILPILKNIFMFGFCVFVFGKEVTGQCGNIVKTPPPTVNLSRREKREREGERERETQRGRSTSFFSPSSLTSSLGDLDLINLSLLKSIGSSLCLLVAGHVFQCK